ncbi:MAG: DUF1835 domain-containing protein [Clostridia bacterium]|nr:DUF1835 domain-containing protein [Clostridia bacterium]
MVNICFSDITYQYLREANYISEEKNAGIDFKKIFSINLQLDNGKISDNGLGDERLDFIKKFHIGYIFGEETPATYDGGFKRYIRVVENLKVLIKNCEAFRIWYTEDNNEYCTFCWLISLFEQLNAQNNIYVVRLPSEHSSGGKYERRYNSACFMPEELLELASTEVLLSETRKEFYVKQWIRAREENSNLRVVLYGNIVSVNEDFYDSAIVIEANKYDGIINEAQLVGNCASKIGLNDIFLGKRIEHMIEKGLFEVVSLPTISTPFYCKKIRKKIQ